MPGTTIPADIIIPQRIKYEFDNDTVLETSVFSKEIRYKPKENVNNKISIWEKESLVVPACLYTSFKLPKISPIKQKHVSK